MSNCNHKKGSSKDFVVTYQRLAAWFAAAAESRTLICVAKVGMSCRSPEAFLMSHFKNRKVVNLVSCLRISLINLFREQALSFPWFGAAGSDVNLRTPLIRPELLPRTRLVRCDKYLCPKRRAERRLHDHVIGLRASHQRRLLSLLSLHTFSGLREHPFRFRPAVPSSGSRGRLDRSRCSATPADTLSSRHVCQLERKPPQPRAANECRRGEFLISFRFVSRKHFAAKTIRH